jgi:hypothetical protein
MDESFLLLAVASCDRHFLKKNKHFFLKKEAKTSYPLLGG